MARVFFSFCSSLLRVDEFLVSYQTRAQVPSLALELVHEAWPGDPFGMSEKSGFGSPVHHDSRHNRKEL